MTTPGEPQNPLVPVVFPTFTPYGCFLRIRCPAPQQELTGGFGYEAQLWGWGYWGVTCHTFMHIRGGGGSNSAVTP
jgi:hypothetical protein